MDEIFLRLIKEKITPNSYYVLHCIKSGMIPTSFVNKDLEIKKLINDGWLNDELQLTDKSIIFTIEINGFFNKSKKKTTTSLLGTSFDENIKSYSDIFPSMKLASGKYARSNSKNLENAFRWFFENYEYNWETIFLATQNYVLEYESKNYEYMRNSQYFLRKQNIDKSWDSDLAIYCEYLKDKPNEEKDIFNELII
jgi:hypothetical protein